MSQPRKIAYHATNPMGEETPVYSTVQEVADDIAEGWDEPSPTVSSPAELQVWLDARVPGCTVVQTPV